MKTNTTSPGRAPQGESLSLTEAKRTLDQVLDRVAEGTVVTLTRRGNPAAVLVPVETYERLLAHQDPLAALRPRFEERFARMQTPEHRAAVDALFKATPEELGRAAVRAARLRKEAQSANPHGDDEFPVP